MDKKINAVFDENGLHLSGELPDGFPNDLNEIIGFNKATSQTEFLKLTVDSLPYLAVITPYSSEGKNFFSVCFTLFSVLKNEIEPNFDTLLQNSVAICRNGMQNIAGLGASISTVLDEAECYDQKKLVSAQIKNCHKVLRSLQNVDDAYNYLNGGLNPIAFRPSDIVKPILNTIKILSQNSNKKVVCESLDENIKIFADVRRFENAFLNILANALLYSSDEATVKISIKKIGTNALITVTDDGYGMSADVVEKAFDAGYTADSKSTRQGLGLFLAKRFTDSCGGSIMISSKENEGTVVTMTIPETENEPNDLQNFISTYGASLFSPVKVALCEVYDSGDFLVL